MSTWTECRITPDGLREIARILHDRHRDFADLDPDNMLPTDRTMVTAWAMRAEAACDNSGQCEIELPATRTWSRETELHWIEGYELLAVNDADAP